jgi:hypothetical protein
MVLFTRTKICRHSSVVEQVTCNDQVVGSNPIVGSKTFCGRAHMMYSRWATPTSYCAETLPHTLVRRSFLAYRSVLVVQDGVLVSQVFSQTHPAGDRQRDHQGDREGNHSLLKAQPVEAPKTAETRTNPSNDTVISCR